MTDNEILIIHGTEYKTMTKKLLEEADLEARIREKAGGRGKNLKIGIKQIGRASCRERV